MEVCITQKQLGFKVTQILDENTFVTPSSIHQNGKIFPIEIKFHKAISIDQLITQIGIQTREGTVIFQGKVINKLEQYLQLESGLYELNENKLDVIFDQPLDDFILQDSKIAIQSTFYYIYDIQTKKTIKVGSTPKKSKFGCVFYPNYLLCGRPNGILWRALIENGEVQNSYKFQGLQFSTMKIIQNNLINLYEQTINIIDLNEMAVLKSLNIEYSCIYFQQYILYGYGQNLYQIKLMDIENAFYQYMEEKNYKAEEIFMTNINLQTYENAKKLAKSIKCEISVDLIKQLSQRKFSLKQGPQITYNAIKQNDDNKENRLPSIQVVKWPFNIRLQPKRTSFKINQQIQNVQNKLNMRKGIKQLEREFQMPIRSIIKLPNNIFIFKILNIKNWQTSLRIVVYQLAIYKFQVDLMMEHQIFAEQVRSVQQYVRKLVRQATLNIYIVN